MNQPTWARFILAWGRRRSLRDAPPLRTDVVTLGNSLSAEKYPFMIHYDTPEKALIDANLRDGRRASIKLPPLPPGVI